MTRESTSLNLSTSKDLFKAILYTGLLAGFLDGVAAILNYMIGGGKNPISIFNYIASGVFGIKMAFSGGLLMAFLGLLFHFIIATGWTTLYFLAYPKLSFLAKNKFVSGVAYGLFVWVMMSQVVLPLSNVPVNPAPFDIYKAMVSIGILMVAIGLPISIRATKYYSGK
jgi:hypothetical protein